MLKQIFKSIERWESSSSWSFWAFAITLYSCFSLCFSTPSISSKLINHDNQSQAQLVAQKIRSGGQSESTPQIPGLRVAPSNKVPVPTPKPSEGSAERLRFSQPAGNPNGGGDDIFDDDIGTKKWENWSCPKPEEVISNPDFWRYLAEDPSICTEEDFCEENEEENEENYEIDLELDPEEKIPRRRLREAGRVGMVNPMPTGKLDQKTIAEYNYVTRPLQPIEFPSREGIRLSMDQRSIRKAVYSHPSELGLSDLGSRVQCPVQSDLTKHQRLDCWAITDQNIREAVVKIFEYTTFDNPRIVTLERFPPGCSNQQATYFIDIVTGNSVYFRIGGKQDGKLWSLGNFKRNEISNMMNDPNIKKITDLSDYNFNF